MDKSERRISRREFTRGSILAAAAAVPPSLAASAAAQTPSQQPALSADSQAEVDSKVLAVLRKYDKLLSNAEKLDVRRLLTEGQKPLDRMRLFSLENADQPANVLKLYPDARDAHAARPRQR